MAARSAGPAAAAGGRARHRGEPRGSPSAVAPQRPVAAIPPAAGRYRHVRAVRRRRKRARLLPHAAPRVRPVRQQAAGVPQRGPGRPEQARDAPAFQGRRRPRAAATSTLSPTSWRSRRLRRGWAPPATSRARPSPWRWWCGLAASCSGLHQRPGSGVLRDTRAAGKARSRREPGVAERPAVQAVDADAGHGQQRAGARAAGRGEVRQRVRAVLLLPADRGAADDRFDPAHDAAGGGRRRASCWRPSRGWSPAGLSCPCGRPRTGRGGSRRAT